MVPNCITGHSALLDIDVPQKKLGSSRGPRGTLY